jgi:hypothetical protein
MINFNTPVNLAIDSSGMGVMPNSIPAAAVYSNNLYIFYVGNGNNGAFFTSYNGQAWTNQVEQVSAGIGIMANTSLSTTAFNDLLYLFYTGNGNNGVFYTTCSSVMTWVPAAVVPGSSPMQGTSPSAVWFNDNLYLFYNNSGNDGIYVSSTGDGNNWSQPSLVGGGKIGMSVAQGTSPNAVVFDDMLYLFFVGGGGGGIFYTTSADGQNWGAVQSVGYSMGQAMMAGANTSPSAVASGSNLYLFWTDVNGQGLLVTSFDGSNWSPAQNMYVGGQLFEPFTSGCAVAYEDIPYVFWVAPISPGGLLVINYASWTQS